ncbi:E3 ubiquitin-protein ligase NRDP1-like [Xenia sp. Carnegie-2017]|uniref:E3 ubiquitin-protein ligase NRDP1-like n=1 Tax=Xenia sp. Carnegie-2017 TaxID=2897299 RepID=UPI001F0433D7|nr:E3 ubiquitin-protein ligase NRDP1-like [Xenia sp. Carnegie-2017]
MAYRSHNNESGYDESRFKNAVDENFHCSICLNIAKDARMCQHNQHIFCCSCIEEHLRVNAQRCPQCQDNLTVATLLPARVINNMISMLKINCHYASRGCPEFINVEDLERHVESCGFAPVLCSNERCDKEINKRDKIK